MITLATIKLSGVKHYSGQYSVSPGSKLVLSRETTNDWDPTAVALFTTEQIQVGYIPQQASRIITGLIIAGYQLHAEVSSEAEDAVSVTLSMEKA